MTYNVLVRYRTKSGVNARTVAIEADSATEALAKAEARVARARGVTRVDSTQWLERPIWAKWEPRR
jgi:4-hydroxyphenylpyruvate dioxygenase-like putative hemolysin